MENINDIRDVQWGVRVQRGTFGVVLRVVLHVVFRVVLRVDFDGNIDRMHPHGRYGKMNDKRATQWEDGGNPNGLKRETHKIATKMIQRTSKRIGKKTIQKNGPKDDQNDTKKELT